MLKDTIISAFNYDGTLLKWLKKVQEALENASASEFRVNKKGNATISFSIVFANGDTLESGNIILQQGESVTGATIRQGHLILTLSNGDELDAGDLGAVTGFSINENQHLIVTYQNGTTQDLGAIFNGTINVNTLTSDNAEISALKPVVEVMTGYDATIGLHTFLTIENVYTSVVKNGNKLTIVSALNLTRTDTISGNPTLVIFTIPQAIGAKLFPTMVGAYNALLFDKFNAVSGTNTFTPIMVMLTKTSDTRIAFSLQYGTTNDLPLNEKAFIRLEATLLLSDGFEL